MPCRTSSSCAAYPATCVPTMDPSSWRVRFRNGLPVRDELLDGEIFYTLCEAKIVIESWRRHYNAIRPHASLGYRAPAPEVFVPALAAWPPAQLQSAAPATLLLHMRPNLN